MRGLSERLTGFTSEHPVASFALASVLTALVGLVDYLTGIELRVFPLYFVPLALIAWQFGRRASVAASAVSMASWETANRLGGLRSEHLWVESLNLFFQFAALAGFGLVVATLCAQLRREQALARVDGLTGIANRRGFEERLQVEMARGARSSLPLVIAYLDLDNFKSINDRAGHQAGDALLRRVAHAAEAVCRKSDVAARLGGDEFALLLTGCDQASATAVLERLQLRLRESAPMGAPPVSVSIGAVCFAAPPASVDTALRQADSLMYRVKRGGKNDLRVESA